MSGAAADIGSTWLLLCTVPPDRADALVTALLEERLIACANVLGPMRSHYRWEGRVESAEELLLLLKTSSSVRLRLRDRILALHPYELPEILEFRADDGLPAYLAWVARSTR